MSDRIQIAPMAALNEQLALVEFYKNRTLVLANQVHELTAALEQAQATIQQLRPAEAADAESGAAGKAH